MIYWFSILFLFVSFINVFPQITIDQPLSNSSFCKSEGLLFKFKTDKSIDILVKRKDSSNYHIINAYPINTNQYLWKEIDQYYLNTKLDFKIVNSSDYSDFILVNNITIYQNTEILSTSESSIFCEGESTELKVETVGFNLKYQWFKDDKILEGQTKHILNLNNLKYENSGKYYCLIKGELDCNTVQSNPIILYVATRTRIIEQPKDQGFAIGAYVKFSVKTHIAGNDEELKYQWYKGYKEIKDGDDNYTFLRFKPRIMGANSHTLEITFALYDDISDSIYCIVTGRCGSDTSHFAKLSEDAFFKFSTMTKRMRICEGKSVVFEVLVNQLGPGTLKYEWFRGKNTPLDTSRTHGINTPILTIEDCKLSDQDVYSLRITHLESGFTAQTDWISLYIESDPIVITKMNDYIVLDRNNPYYGKVHIALGSLLLIDRYKFEWYKNDTLFFSGSGGLGNELNINNPTINDEGKYYCIIKGDCGSVYTDTFNIYLGYKDVIACEGTDTVLNVRKHKLDKGQFEYYWTFKDFEIKDYGRYEGTKTLSLTIKSLTPLQSGYYYSYAVDPITKQTYYNGAIYLDVATPPLITELFFSNPIYMNKTTMTQKMMTVQSKTTMRIELYKDDKFLASKTFTPTDWRYTDYTFFLKCNTASNNNCLYGILQSGIYKIKFTNDCGESWSDEFEIINTDSDKGMVRNTDEDFINGNTEEHFDNTKYRNSSINLKSIAKNINKQSLTVYPNPSADKITIQGDIQDYSTIQIYDIMGLEVTYKLTNQTTFVDTNSLQIDISPLPIGVYYIKIGDRIARFIKV